MLTRYIKMSLSHIDDLLGIFVDELDSCFQPSRASVHFFAYFELILRQKGILDLKKLSLKQFVAGLTGKMEQDKPYKLISLHLFLL